MFQMFSWFLLIKTVRDIIGRHNRNSNDQGLSIKTLHSFCHWEKLYIIVQIILKLYSDLF